MQNTVDNNLGLQIKQIAPRLETSNYMMQSKKTFQNPIFSKLNKIFLEPKAKPLPKQQQNEPAVQFKTQLTSRVNKQTCHTQINSLKFNNLAKKQELITAQTESSRVFLFSDPSLAELKSNFSKQNLLKENILKQNNLSKNILKQNNFQFSNLDPSSDKLISFQYLKRHEGKQNRIEVDESLRLKNIKGVRNEKTGNYYSKSTNNLLDVGDNVGQCKFFYQNHKLQRIHKPRLFSSIPLKELEDQRQQVREDLSQQQRQTHSALPTTNLPHLSQLMPSQHPSSFSSHYQARISQLQQRVEYYQKMQQFYLDQIETYRQEKTTLQWKLNLIVEELLSLTMKQKNMSKGTAKFNQSLIKQSKQLIMSKIHQLNFSSTAKLKISDIIIKENKENLYSDNLIQESQVVQLLDFDHINFNSIRNNTPDQYKHPLHAVALDATSRYVSSFVLDNVTLVQSEGEDDIEDLKVNKEREILKEQIYCHSSEQNLRPPQILSFT